MQLPRRTLREGFTLPVIGFGGMVVIGMEQPAVNRLAAECLDRGLNYFDVAPFYGNGEAEEKLGIALEPMRQNVFLAGKTLQRDAVGVKGELERSLRRLRTDHLDLYQFHAVTTLKEVERIFARGGAAEAFMQARAAGKVKFLGFSAHSVEAALAMLEGFSFDSLLIPVNFVSYARGDFGPQVLKAASRRGVARIALKSMALSPWAKREKHTWVKCWYKPIEDADLARLALRFALSEDVVSALPPGEERLFRLALDVAAEFKPLSDEERRDLLSRASKFRPLFKN
jgi:aryl-alcohol dehydrogenase-like predicted oxidoreductase